MPEAIAAPPIGLDEVAIVNWIIIIWVVIHLRARRCELDTDRFLWAFVWIASDDEAVSPWLTPIAVALQVL